MALALKMSQFLDPLLQSGGYVVSDQPIEVTGWIPQELPNNVKPGRYHIYQKK